MPRWVCRSRPAAPAPAPAPLRRRLAAIFAAAGHDHLELRRHNIEQFRDVLADLVLEAAATRAGLVRYIADGLFARQIAAAARRALLSPARPLLSSLLGRFGGFAVYYSRGSRGFRRRLGKTDTWLIAICEFDAGFLKCTPQLVHCRLLGIRSIFDTRDRISSNASFFCEFSHAPPDCRARHPKLNRLHWYIVQTGVDIVPTFVVMQVYNVPILVPEQTQWTNIICAVGTLSVARMPGSSWAAMKQPWSACGGRNGARPSRRTCPATSSCSSGPPPSSSTAPGTSAIPPARLRRPAQS